MPYIKKKDRKKFDMWNSYKVPSTCGELNYIFSCIIRAYIRIKGECYQTYNDIIGALENCKIELYRRKIAKYEDKKIKENGDVY